MSSNKNIWLFGRSIDILLLFVPVWVVWLVCFVLPSETLQADVAIWVWVVVVVGIDVSHVWSTIFRTYLDKEEFGQHKRLLIMSPILVFLVVFLVASYSQMLFWSILAYLALYHFIKQQYGFLRIYKAKHKSGHKQILKDEWMIYLSMLYPVIYWHLSPAREFEWFVEGDFFLLDKLVSEQLFYQITLVANIIYWGFLIWWVVQEIRANQTNIPWGKILWLLTTAGNWYIGIVFFNSDLVFTLTNVVAHGLPYMALVFFYVERKKLIKEEKRTIKPGPVIVHVSMMLLVILILAFGEEYLWDAWIYRDNEAFFGSVLPLTKEALSNPWLQAAGIALLTIPQATHYILDGFIWKGNDKNPYVKKVLISG
ncbi:MAG: hypothetical protein NXI20_06945 [bacterium]|nr:hypothetical protein [bacterium]